MKNNKYLNFSIKGQGQPLISLISEACKNGIYTNAKNIIPISVGFDSRTIAAWFHKNKIPAYGVTTVDPTWKPLVGNLSDTEIAKQLAKSLNIQWEYYDFVEPRAKDLVMLLKIKKGLIYLGYGFLIQFIDKLKHKHDSSAINVFVGYSGDRILADLSMRYTSLDELTRSIMAIRVFLPLKDVAALVQIKENEIVDEIRNTLSSYPEENLGQKLVHFIFYGRQFKFVFEAEDIHRLYFWITINYLRGADLGEYDSIIVPSEGSVTELKELGARNFNIVHFGVDPDVFSPVTIKKDIDFFFFGNGGFARAKNLKMMITEPSRILDYKFIVSGRSIDIDLGKARLLPPLSLNGFRNFCCRAKVNLNVVRKLHADVFATSTSRPFELAAMQCCIVSAPYNGLENWFELKKEILVANTSKECTEIYQMLIDDDEMRMNMGVAARNRVKKEHTSRHRARQIIQILEKYQS